MTIKGFVKIGDSTLVNDVRENLVSFFDYNLLLKGNYIDVGRSGSDGLFSIYSDPRYTSGRVWKCPNSNWVWESGVGATLSSGLYINGTFYPPTTTGTYSYYIDYPNGLAFFNTALPSTSSVRSDYSYRYINVCKADGLQWFKRLGIDDTEILPENQLKPPILGVELASRKLAPYQLGGGQYVYTDFLIHCVSEDPYIRDTLVDVVSYQKDLSFQMYDLNEIADNNNFPLDYRGVPASGAYTFPLLCENYPGRTLTINNASLESSYTLGRLHIGTVRISTEVIHFGV